MPKNGCALKREAVIRLVLIVSLIGSLSGLTGCRGGLANSSHALELQEVGSSVKACLARHQGKPVLIAFVTQSSPSGLFPRHALQTDDANAALRRHGVVPVIADVTARPDLLSFLEVYGRVGIPFVVLYSSDRAQKHYMPADTIYATNKSGVVIPDGAAIAGFIREHL
jgi:hypothetical protein